MSDNIHVAVRIRPLIEREVESNCNILWDTRDSTVIYQRNLPSTEYCFDRVFNINDGNASIYQDLCAPIVRSVMEGFNGTIFAYGQTSSGKTYTMMGEYGIIPSAIHDIFDAIDSMPEREFLLRVSYMEIYNEHVLDLLTKDSKNLKPFEDSDGNISVLGLSEEEIKTSAEVFRIMKRGEKKRSIGDTKMNEKSSRSHAIFRMIIESRMRNAADDDSVVNVGQLNLVDLAGSERSGQMGITGKTFKEGTKINISLLMLTQVISQLSKGDRQYVSFRDSKLTRILQNSLGGNARTVIICTVTPASIQETLSTLNFASSAKRIKNKPTANIVSNDKTLLKRYTSEIKQLSEKLEALQQMDDCGKKKILEKELEEKNKQNENLKQQIHDLKEKFVVSQFTTDCPNLIVNKKNRRETWCGGIGRKNNFGHNLRNRLPNLNEEALDSEFFTSTVDFFERDRRDRVPSFMSPSSTEFKFSDDKINMDVSIQTEMSKIEDHDTVKMPQEHDSLLAENSQQKIQIEDMSQQIIKLMSQINDLQNEQKLNSNEFSIYNNNCSPSNKLSIFDEIQMSEMKECVNTSAQTNRSLNCIQALEESTQTIMDSLKDTDVQTEEKNCFNKSAQFEYFTKNNTCQTDHTVSMDTAVQTINIEFEEVKTEADEKLLLCNNCSTKCTNFEMAPRLMTVENVESMNQVLDDVLTSYQALKTKCQSFINNMKSFEFDPSSDHDVNELQLAAQNDITQLIEQHIIIKHEEEVKNFKNCIENLKLDVDGNMKEIQRLQNLCTEKDKELETVFENLSQTKQEISTKDNELLKCQQETLEKYNKYLMILKEKKDLQDQFKNTENIIVKKDKEINDIKMKMTVMESEYIQMKAELLETVKLLSISNEEVSTGKINFNDLLYTYEQEKEKLIRENALLKTQIQTHIENYDEIIKDLKFNQEQRIVAIENRLKRTYEEKIITIQKNIKDNHNLELMDEIDKLKIQIRVQSSNFKLEKVKFEEEFMKANHVNGTISKLKNKLLMKDEECQKLKVIIEELHIEKSSKNDENSIEMLNTIQKKLEEREMAFIEIQKKCEASEKLVTDLNTAKKADTQNIQDLERKKSHLENLVKERESIIKQNNSKFNLLKTEYGQEYKKLKLEIETLKKTQDDNKSKSKESPKDDSIETDNTNKAKFSTLKENEDVEKQFEINELKLRNQKLRKDNGILGQKLALCQNEIRRLHELQNESKIGKESPKKSSTESVLSSNPEFQTLLHQKEKYIKRLEKENKKYQEYLKAKGHHRVVDEASSTQSSTDHGNENKLSFSDTPASNSLANKLLKYEFTHSQPNPKVKCVTPLSNRNNIPSPGSKRTVPYPRIGSHQQSVFTAIKPHMDLEHDDQNCKQQ